MDFLLEFEVQEKITTRLGSNEKDGIGIDTHRDMDIDREEV